MVDKIISPSIFSIVTKKTDTMSQFEKILNDRNQEKHTKKSLWEYALSKEEFDSLVTSLGVAGSLANIDPRDCALYYAEWWKRMYNGGYPSKKEIFSSLQARQLFNEEDFYQYAKRGARLLGIKWIKNQNTLYFKTLLLQGGLPVKHISNNFGSYKKFLLRILDIMPDTIDDFAFDFEITSLLPPSSRNDTIYECCLEIVKAILNDDERFLPILKNNRELEIIESELRIRKQTLQLKRKKSKVRCEWIIEPQKEQVRLYLGFPDSIDADVFATLFTNDDTSNTLGYEYKLFVNDNLICKFWKKVDGSYRTIRISQTDLVWGGSEHLPEIYLIDTNGRKTECKQLVTHMPNLNKPSIWTKYSDVEWILAKGTNIKQPEGYILSPLAFTTNTVVETKTVTISSNQYNWGACQGSIEYAHNNESYNFKTSSKEIEWYIIEDKPEWIKKANCPVVRRKPRVLVYNHDGNTIVKPGLEWRLKGSLPWLEWDAGTMPAGHIEVRISVDEIVETDVFFNIANFELKTVSNTLHQAEIELINNQFRFRINEDAFVSIIEKRHDKFHVVLKNNEIIPKAILASVAHGSQTTGLRFEMLPPFHGVAILDNEGKIMPEGHCFLMENLNGYQLMSNQNDISVNIYNNRRRSIIISKPLHNQLVALREFEDRILQLANLSDAMDNDIEVILEICENTGSGQRRIPYSFKRYNTRINWSINEDDGINLTLDGDMQPDLYAVPVDCSFKKLIPYDLINENGCYKFREGVTLEKFVVFSNKESAVKVQPVLINLNSMNDPEAIAESRMQQTLEFKEQLLESKHTDDAWQIVLTYYGICQQNGLPFSTFDALRCLGDSSELAAKGFVFLACFDESLSFAEVNYRYLEDDIGFAFHWICKNDWATAMDWIGCVCDDELNEYMANTIKNHYENLYPMNNFKNMANYIIQDKKPPVSSNFFLNGRVIDLRMTLGARVLKELPQNSPKIPEIYKKILEVNSENANIKILLKSPLAIALSIDGKDSGIWDDKRDDIRRNVKYAHQLNPDWYSEAINYCLNKLKTLN